MAFEPKKFNDIVGEMQKRITGLNDFEVGSVTRTLFESFSYELALLYEKMNLVYLSAFIDSAEGINLDQVVAVLGVKRGLPDFATGIVTFERDRGNNDILIPLGTLVATEDKQGSPKKTYQTIEEKILLSIDSAIDVKVQALVRGEEQNATENTVIVMPRPVPGIKSVINIGKVQLKGKERETDEALRERAKNTLISAGKATILSIENALLSQTGVLDAKVKEDFLFPQGEATLNRKSNATGDITLPRNSQVSATIAGQEKILRTKSEVFLKDGLTKTQVKLQAPLEGRLGEISTAQLNGVIWKFQKPEIEAQLEVTDLQTIALADFGVIDVFVDGPDLDNPTEHQRITNEIDRVKAAGIYVRLDSVQPVFVDGIFRIDSRQNLDAEEIKLLEKSVAIAIQDVIEKTKMGNTLLFSKLLKEVISVEGAENLADFQIFITTKRAEGRKKYALSDNKIEIEEAERFKARDICVAANDKTLFIDLELQVEDLEETNFKTLQNTLNDYTDTLPRGTVFKVLDLHNKLNDSGLLVHFDTLKLNPRPWSSRGNLLIMDPTIPTMVVEVDVSFVEKAAIGRIFAYSSFLEITGAMRIVLSGNLPQQGAKAIMSKVQLALNDYLDGLGPEEDVVLDDLLAAAKKVNGVLDGSWELDDFQVSLNAKGGVTEEPQRISSGKIAVNPFEKARLRANAFCLAYKTEEVTIEVTTLKLKLQAAGITDPKKAELKTLTANIINNFLANFQPGDDLDFNALRTAVENRLPTVPAIVDNLVIVAKSTADGREQTASTTNPTKIHIRSVELARMATFVETKIELVDPVTR